MEFCSWWGSLWMAVFLLNDASCDLSSHRRYILSQKEVTFDRAVTDCSPGFLPQMATKHEVQEILQFLDQSMVNMTVWIGLRKPKSECTVDSKPLKGFKWVETGSQEWSFTYWLKEPKLTCTEDLCGALRRQVVQSQVTLGLIPDSCKTPYHFICKLRDGQPGPSLEISQTTMRPVPADPQPKPTTAITSPPTVRSDPTSQPNSLTLGPESCENQNPKHPSIRSLTADPSNSSRVLVECWSEVKVEVVCSGVPAVWRVLNGSLADFSVLCQCEAGFQEEDSGLCVDIDECSTGSPCQHTCLNTQGSYRCVCGADQDSPCEQDVPPANGKMSLSHVLIPVLAVVAVLLVILAVVVVVKCCLKRREKKKRTKP
ncbi:C-type lectin domain family 14 member A [Cyprinodon tularosa]|uniref:C-type lectin domain family 14 member A n=1 Tax=Cyprinodon tularosa TaxID=77115 RepID=UPI0018E1E307|nr:C-type lectin domain family 14 member A [Cyprinodon tularosa]